MTITLRQESQAGTTTKGSSLTYAELDNNFIDLLTNKILPLQIDADTGSVKVGQAQNNGVFTITGAGGITTTVTEDSGGNANLTITKSTDDLGIFEIVGGSNIEATQPDSGGSVTLEVTNPAVLNVDGAVVFTAKNTSGVTIEKGQVVYISGHDGTNPTIAVADADDAAKMPAFGLANEQITNTNTGEIITYGPITNIDTSHFTAGEELFVNTTSDSADDTITSSAPTGETGLIQKIGKVIRSHASTGTIFVTGAGRTNATPNLNDGNIFIGNAQNQVSTTAFAISLDTSPTLGGALDANSNNFTNVGTINTHTIPGGTGTFALTSDLIDTQIVGGTDITVTQPDSSGAFTVAYSGSAISNVSEDSTPQLGGDLDVNSNSIVSVSNGNIPITPNGTGQAQITNLQYDEDIHTLSYAATITPDVANGNVQTITLTGDLTFSAFSNPIAGQSLTLIIDTNGTGRTLTSTMKFAGGTKTLSTTDTTDIMTVFYDGTNYWASLSTNFS